MPHRELHRKLARLRSRLRRLIIIAGVSRTLVILVAVLAVALGLDWLLRLETPGRAVLLALGAGLVLTTLWRHLIAPLRVGLADERLALLLERRFPDLRDRLISTVQFARIPDASPLSASMVERLTQDTLEQTAAVDFQEATTSRPVAWWAVAAGAELVLASAYVLTFPATAAIFAARFFNPASSAQWPRRTQLTVRAYDKAGHPLAPEGNRLFVPKGEDLRVVVRAARFSGKLWRAPDRVAVHYEFAGGGSGRRFVSEDAEATYTTYFTTVTDGFSFYATGDDARTATYEVQVRNRPRIESIRITVQAPAYTGEPQRILTDGSGSITALAGSQALITITTNKPIAAEPGSASIVLSDGSRVPMTFVEEQPTHLRGTVTLEARHKHYAIALTDTDGLTNSPASTYRLNVQGDREPVVTLPEPGRSKRITAKATVPIRLVARDDYGVVKSRLLFRRGESAEAEAQTHAFPPSQPPAKKVEHKHEWDLTPLALQERDVLQLSAEAEDTFKATRDGESVSPNVGRSPVYRLTVISEAEMTSLVQRRLEEIKVKLEKLAQRQDTAKTDTETLAQREEQADRRELKLGEREQLRIAAGTAKATEELDQALDDLENNNVGNLEDRRRVRELADALRPLAARDMPDTARKITAAAQADTQKKQRQQLTNAARKQQRIADDLRAALARFDQWSDIDELVRDASELLLEQKKLNERTTELARKLFGKPAEKLTDDEKGAARSLARAQRGARDTMKALEEKMARTAEHLQKSDPAAAKAIQQALSQANADQIRSRMDSAASRIQQAKPASARPLQTQSSEALKRLLDTLNQARSPYLARDLRKLQEQIAKQLEDVDRLLKEQKRQLAETQLANLRHKLQALRNQQQATQEASQQKNASPAKVAKQAQAQSQHARDAEKLGRQLERLQPQKPKEKKPIEAASKSVQDAASKMSDAAKSLEQVDPKQPDTANQAARQKAAGPQKEAAEKLAQADRELEKLQKQLAKGKSEHKRLPERAQEQAKTEKQTADAAKNLNKASQQAKGMAPKTGQDLQKAGQQTQQAKQAMSKAKGQLQKAAQKPNESGPQQQQAEQEQEKAARDLQKARDQLAKAQQELDQQRRQKEIFEIGKALAAMLAEQVAIRQGTEKLHKATDAGRKPLNHPQKLKLQELTDDQGTLYEKCGDVVLRLEKESVPVFHYVMTDTAKAMVEVQKLLREAKLGWLTQDTEREIERNLSHLLAALKKEAQRLAKKQRKQRRGGGGGGKQPDKPQPLVPPLAQIKQLRTLQVTLNEKTRALEVDKQTQLTRRQRLFQRRAQRLATKQRELGELSERFADDLEKGDTEEKMGPP